MGYTPVPPEPGKVEMEELEQEETACSLLFKFLFEIISGEITNVDEVELEVLISPILFLLGLVAFKTKTSGNSLEVAIRAKSSEIYDPSVSKRFDVGTGAVGGATGMGFECNFEQTGPIEENPPASDRSAPGQADHVG